MSSGHTEQSVFMALGKRFPPGAFTMIPQVSNTTGYAKSRTIDAVVVSNWPSRGLWVGGIETKVSKSDWRRELADPAKADPIMQYCSYWWVAAPTGVVPVGEVPETWGLLEVSGNGVREAKAAPKLDTKPLSPGFVCALLRAATKGMIPKKDLDLRVAEEVQRQREYAERADPAWKDRYQKLQAAVRSFEDKTGLNVQFSYDAELLGPLVRALRHTNPNGLISQYEYLARMARTLEVNAEAAIEELRGWDPGGLSGPQEEELL